MFGSIQDQLHEAVKEHDGAFTRKLAERLVRAIDDHRKGKPAENAEITMDIYGVICDLDAYAGRPTTHTAVTVLRRALDYSINAARIDALTAHRELQEMANG